MLYLTNVVCKQKLFYVGQDMVWGHVYLYTLYIKYLLVLEGLVWWPLAWQFAHE